MYRQNKEKPSNTTPITGGCWTDTTNTIYIRLFKERNRWKVSVLNIYTLPFCYRGLFTLSSSLWMLKHHFRTPELEKSSAQLHTAARCCFHNRSKEAPMYRKAGHKQLIRVPSWEPPIPAWKYTYFGRSTQIPSSLRSWPSKENNTNINSNSWVSKISWKFI